MIKLFTTRLPRYVIRWVDVVGDGVYKQDMGTLLRYSRLILV